MTAHHLSHAGSLFYGAAHYGASSNERRGAPITPLYLVELGSPVVGDIDALIKAATSTELPDTETVTYTFPASAVSPTDGVLSATGVLDVPRNINMTTTHGSSIVAMTVTVTGTDVYGEALVETVEVAATGTSATDSGLKAFKTVTSIAITAAANAEANTINIGFGDVLGLPYRIDAGKVMQWIENNLPHVGTLGTFVAADATTATATTGDVRGTYDPNNTLTGSLPIAALVSLNPTSKESLFGIAQYGG
jgi:hypothetical protein